MLNGLTLEEVIALKLEMASKPLNRKACMALKYGTH